MEGVWGVKVAWASMGADYGLPVVVSWKTETRMGRAEG